MAGLIQSIAVLIVSLADLTFRWFIDLTDISYLDSDCLLAIETDPVCADTSWGLWNASGLLFCCLADQVGDTSGACESDQTVLPSSLEADLVSLLFAG